MTNESAFIRLSYLFTSGIPGVIGTIAHVYWLSKPPEILVEFEIFFFSQRRRAIFFSIESEASRCNIPDPIVSWLPTRRSLLTD